MIQGETADVDVQLTKWLEEGDYGDYEGMTFHGIQEARMTEFGDATWDIWREGYPGGEYVVHGCYACPHLLRQDYPNGWGFYDMRIDIFGAKQDHSHLDPRSKSPIASTSKLIAEIKAVIEGNSVSWPGGQIISHRSQHAQDILCVAHGHILAALAIRWVGLPLDTEMMRLILVPGGVRVSIFSVSFVLICRCA
jgi:sedoheptulose-bisphosphatase